MRVSVPIVRSNKVFETGSFSVVMKEKKKSTADEKLEPSYGNSKLLCRCW